MLEAERRMIEVIFVVSLLTVIIKDIKKTKPQMILRFYFIGN